VVIRHRYYGNRGFKHRCCTTSGHQAQHDKTTSCAAVCPVIIYLKSSSTRPPPFAARDENWGVYYYALRLAMTSTLAETHQSHLGAPVQPRGTFTRNPDAIRSQHDAKLVAPIIRVNLPCHGSSTISDTQIAVIRWTDRPTARKLANSSTCP
jgi:hypothetical protein